MTSPLYRIIRRSTGSLQPDGTTWSVEVLYCGYDRHSARQAYHASEPEDFGGGYGNGKRETIGETVTDAETGDFADDVVSAAG